ncbi:VQ motif-containing protein 20-like [Nicotiana sylvestris]|uniref:VQ domain-containing protein n=1 Tax=Nicotiana sylvestris TaxID=4096 RepID=A0A1U7V3P0_NICSY|nr:PREDICTED: putative uncharacterized protein DDB_G0267840 [Nicotiana sylvestris]
MSHAQFYDNHAIKADQAMISNNNNVSPPLKINKNSHLIKKSSSNSLSSSSSSSSLFNGVATTTSTIIHQQPRHPIIIHTHPPKVIHTHPRDFMALVQKLTGFSREDDNSSPSHPPLPLPQHLKSEPINKEEDPVSGPESCLGDILRPDKEIIYQNNNINKKCELLANDDNESTSVVTDENSGNCSLGDAQVNSSASCYVPPPTTIFDLPNINDINSGIINYNNLNDPTIFLDSNNAPFPSPNSTDLFFSDQPFCNYTDSFFLMPSTSMRSSFSSSSSENIKELPDF